MSITGKREGRELEGLLAVRLGVWMSPEHLRWRQGVSHSPSPEGLDEEIPDLDVRKGGGGAVAANRVWCCGRVVTTTCHTARPETAPETSTETQAGFASRKSIGRTDRRLVISSERGEGIFIVCVCGGDVFQVC